MSGFVLHRRIRPAFTLVELLVVVAIIALLLSILLPSLTKAKELSKRTKCLTNLKDQISACYSYGEDDDKDNLIPLHHRFANGTGSGPDSQGAWINAARKAYGGKSGRYDYTETLDPGTPWPDTTMMGRFSTANGMGPATRPLNKYLYKSVQDRFDAPLESQRLDEKLQFDYFKCPSDVGYANTEGKIYLGLGIGYAENDSFYNTMGSSYSTDSILLGVPPGGDLTAIGPWLRPYTHIPNPSRVTMLKETKGFYASGWNAIQPSGGPSLVDEDYYTIGNHGVLREHNVGFADAHAQPVLYDVRTDVFNVVNEQVVHSGIFKRRGGWLEQTEVPPGDVVPPFTLDSLKHLLYSGPDWADHCFPAPPVATGLHL